MKTLLIATDLSANAAQVAGYAYRLAQAMGTKLVLCYTINVPAEIPQNGIVAWPQGVYDDLDRDSKEELAKLKDQLIATSEPETSQPEVVCVQDAGLVTDVINTQAIRQKADLIIIGAHGNDRLGTWMIGNHSRKLIEAAVRPLLLVPAGVAYQPIKRIAFSSDFKYPEADLKALGELVVLAKALDAELVLTHIDQGKDDPEHTSVVKASLSELMRKLDHGKVSTKVIKSERVANGLDWLARHGHIDLLAMLHHRHGFFDQLIHGSRTQQAASQIPVPLLIFKNDENEN
jgi:nucleotide-binding universal stress UspA family protein